MKTKINFLLPENKNPGGAEKTTLEFYEHIKTKTNTELVYLKSPLSSKGLLREIIGFPLAVRKFNKKNKDFVYYLSNSFSLLFSKKEKFKSVLACRTLLFRQFDSFSKNLGFKYKIIFNDFTRWLIRKIESVSLRRAIKIIVYRESIKKEVVEKIGVKEKNVIVIPQGVTPLENIPERNYKKKGIKILFVGGKGSLLKNFDRYIELSNIFRENKKIKFIAIVRSIAKGLEIKSRESNVDIKINLRKEEIEKYLKQADIFFMPSLSETGPRVTLDAMNYGLPIIGTREGLGEYCDSKGGLLISETNIEEWKEKILFLTNNTKIRKRMGEYNYKRVKERFTKKRQLEAELKLIRSLMEKNERK